MDDFVVSFMKYAPPDIRSAFEAELPSLLRREPLAGAEQRRPPSGPWGSRAVGRGRLCSGLVSFDGFCGLRSAVLALRVLSLPTRPSVASRPQGQSADQSTIWDLLTSYGRGQFSSF